MTPCKYRPLGTRVVLKFLKMESQSPILLPDGAKNLRQHQEYEVMAVGGEVNDSKFSLNVGEIVLAAYHPAEVLPLDEDQKLFMVDRTKIVAAVDRNHQN